MAGWAAWFPQVQAGMSPAPQVWLGGIEDGATWANTSDALQLSPAEHQSIKAAFTDDSPLRAQGIRINGVKYMYLRKDDNGGCVLLLGKMKDKGFVTIGKSKACLVIGIGAEGTQQGHLNNNVVNTCSALEGAGF